VRTPAVGSPDAAADRLCAALEDYEEEAANAILNRALSAFSLDVFSGSVALPAIAEIDNRWAPGEVSVDRESANQLLVSSGDGNATDYFSPRFVVRRGDWAPVGLRPIEPPPRQR
jgi:hypothetical protein